MGEMELNESHPAMGLATLALASRQGPLFCSELLHEHAVRLTVFRASLDRETGEPSGGEEVFRAEMTAGQLGSLLARPGEPVPVTVRRVGKVAVPPPPLPSLAEAWVERFRAVAAEATARSPELGSVAAEMLSLFRAELLRQLAEVHFVRTTCAGR